MHDDQEPLEEEQNEQLFYVVHTADSVPLCIEAERQVESNERVEFFSNDTRVAWFWLEDVSGVVCGTAWVGSGLDGPASPTEQSLNDMREQARNLLVEEVTAHQMTCQEDECLHVENLAAWIAHSVGVRNGSLTKLCELIRGYNEKCPGCTELN